MENRTLFDIMKKTFIFDNYIYKLVVRMPI